MFQISENAKHITKQYKQLYSDIPWNTLYGFRNRIVHDYGHVDLTIIYNTLTVDIPLVTKKINESYGH